MKKQLIALSLIALLLSGCSSSNSNQNAKSVAEAISKSGLPCENQLVESDEVRCEASGNIYQVLIGITPLSEGKKAKDTYNEAALSGLPLPYSWCRDDEKNSPEMLAFGDNWVAFSKSPLVPVEELASSLGGSSVSHSEFCTKFFPE
jgi:hypothetical protein